MAGGGCTGGGGGGGGGISGERGGSGIGGTPARRRQQRPGQRRPRRQPRQPAARAPGDERCGERRGRGGRQASRQCGCQQRRGFATVDVVGWCLSRPPTAAAGCWWPLPVTSMPHCPTRVRRRSVSTLLQWGTIGGGARSRQTGGWWRALAVTVAFFALASAALRGIAWSAPCGGQCVSC